MKITKVETFLLEVPLQDRGFWSSQCRFQHRKSMLVCIHTDEGVCGWGEAGQYGPAEPVMSAVTHVLAPMLLGRDPLANNVHWDRMYAETRDFGRKGTILEAISAVDIALWDILGKTHGVPVYALLGGSFRETVSTYATGFYYAGGDFAMDKALDFCRREAEERSAAGFRALKMKVGLLHPRQDLERVAAVRQAAGAETLLMVDANHAYRAHTAIGIAKGMEEFGVYWFEEPVPPEDLDGYKRVKAATTIAIAGGECEYTRYGFGKWFSAGALDVVQPDPCCAGGISEVRRIADFASAFHVQCIPHVWGSAVALAAGLQVLASLPPMPHTANPIAPYNEPLLEWDSTPNPLRTDLLHEPVRIFDGSVAVPSGAGLGIEIDDSELRRHMVAHDCADETSHRQIPLRSSFNRPLQVGGPSPTRSG